MLVQLLIFIIALIAFYRYKEVGTEAHIQYQRKKYITLVMILFAIQSGLRNVAVGSDTYQYYLRFEETRRSTLFDLWQNVIDFFQLGIGKDPGYDILVKLFSVIFPNYRLFLIAVAIFFFWSFGRLLYKYSISNTVVLLMVALYQVLFYGFFSITGIRQTIATGFLLLAVPYVFDKKFIKFIILVLIAATQHKSAVLFGLFYPLSYVKNPKIVLLISIVGFVPMLLGGKYFASYFVYNTFFDQYAGYLEENSAAVGYTVTAFMLVQALCILFSIKKITIISSNNILFINAIGLSVLLTPLILVDPSNMRIVQYYSIFTLLIFPMFCQVWGSNKGVSSIRSLNPFSTSVYLFLSVYSLVRNVDYAFFWQDMTLGANYDAGSMVVNDFILNIF